MFESSWIDQPELRAEYGAVVEALYSPTVWQTLTAVAKDDDLADEIRQDVAIKVSTRFANADRNGESAPIIDHHHAYLAKAGKNRLVDLMAANSWIVGPLGDDGIWDPPDQSDQQQVPDIAAVDVADAEAFLRSVRDRSPVAPVILGPAYQRQWATIKSGQRRKLVARRFAVCALITSWQGTADRLFAPELATAMQVPIEADDGQWLQVPVNHFYGLTDPDWSAVYATTPPTDRGSGPDVRGAAGSDYRFLRREYRGNRDGDIPTEERDSSASWYGVGALLRLIYGDLVTGVVEDR